MEKLNILSFSRPKLKEELVSKFNFKSYACDQIFKWVYKQKILDFDLMTNISKENRDILSKNFYFDLPVIKKRLESKDQSIKYLFELKDKSLIESVFIKQESRNTLCISSQVGCSMGCVFCKTAELGFKRNLDTYEIIGQVMIVLKDIEELDKNLRVSNIVFMGMGEPLLNYEAVKESVFIVNDDFGFNISSRKITISTCGYIPGINLLNKDLLPISLAVSLNASNNKTRSELMPINKTYPIEELLQTLKDFSLKPRDKITIEYVLINKVNDSDKDLKDLIDILSSIKCKINLIPYNPTDNNKFKAPSIDKINQWQEKLLSSRIHTSIRWSKGADINAACGQLAGS